MSHTNCGPLGFPMPDKMAQNLDQVLKALPKSKEYEYRKTIQANATAELSQGERSDVSWISTECLDRYNHVVMAKGMNDSQYNLNPIVTLNHCYDMPPIGRSLWRKVAKDGDTRGIKAKTIYPAKPDGWPEDECWTPDTVFALIQAGLLNAKSIGWQPTKVHWADEKEAKKNGWPWPNETLVVEEWLLIEYAACSIGVNPETVVETVTKTAARPTEAMVRALGWPTIAPKPQPTELKAIRFTHVGQLEQALQHAVEQINVEKLLTDTIDRKRGRV